MGKVQIIWDALDGTSWDDQLARTHAPLQQHAAYGEVARLSGNNIHRAQVMVNDNCVALAQLVVHQRLGLRFGFWLYAPVWLLHVDTATKVAAVQQLRATCPVNKLIHVWTDAHMEALTTHPPAPQLMDNDNAIAMMQEANFRRVLTGESRVWWDISGTLDDIENAMDLKWRTSLKKGQTPTVKVRSGGAQPDHYAWLLAAENAQQHKLGYRQLPLGFVAAFDTLSADKRAVLTLRAEEKGEKIAGVLFLLHGSTASYHLSWNNDQGRTRAATNRLLWEAIPRLKKHGITRIDLGGIDNTNSGLAHFKLGTGGLPVRSAGSFMPRLFSLSKPTLIGLTPTPNTQGI